MTRRTPKRASGGGSGAGRKRSRAGRSGAARGGSSGKRKQKQTSPPRCYEIVEHFPGETLKLRIRSSAYASPSKRARVTQEAEDSSESEGEEEEHRFRIDTPAVFTDGKYEWTLEDERNALRHKLRLKRKEFLEYQRKQNAHGKTAKKGNKSSSSYFDIADLIRKKEKKNEWIKVRKNKRKKMKKAADKSVDELGMNYIFLCGTVIRICVDGKKDWRRALITKFNPKDGRHYVEIEEEGAEDELVGKWAEERNKADGEQDEVMTRVESHGNDDDSEETESDGRGEKTKIERRRRGTGRQKTVSGSQRRLEDEVRLMGELGRRKGRWMRLSKYRVQEYIGMCWAKVRGMPEWPSQIAREHYADKETKKSNKLTVLFCGLHTHAELHRDKLVRWDALVNKRPQRNVREEWKDAVRMGKKFYGLHTSLREQYKEQAEQQIELMRTANAPPEDWVGKRISIFFSGDGKWFEATVFGLNRQTGKHFVFYDDGENEWTNLTAMKRDEIRILSQGGEEKRREEMTVEAEEAEAVREVCWFCKAPVVRNTEDKEFERLHCTGCQRTCHVHCFNAFKKSVEEKFDRERLNPALATTSVKLGSGAFGDPQQPWCDDCSRRCEYCRLKKKSRIHTLLACEICQRKFHAECLDPKLESVPLNGWVCRDCMTCQCCNTTRLDEDNRYTQLVTEAKRRKLAQKSKAKTLILKFSQSSQRSKPSKVKNSRKGSRGGSKCKRLKAQESKTMEEEEEEEREEIKTLEWMHYSVCPRCTDKFEVRRYCPGCMLPLTDDLKIENTVKCDTCFRFVHRECSGMHEKAYEALMRNREERAKLALETPKKPEPEKEEFKPGSQTVIAIPGSEDRPHPTIRYECPECINRRGTNCMARVLERLIHEDQYCVFLHPVSDEHAPNYSRIIKTPMDFSTICKRLKALEYDEEQLRQHVNLVWRNALDYNPSDNMVARLALRLQRLSIGLFATLSRRLKNLENEQKWKKGESQDLLKLTGAGAVTEMKTENSHKADSDESGNESDDMSLKDDPRLQKPLCNQTKFGIKIRASVGPETLRHINLLIRSTDMCTICGSMSDQEKMAFCLDCGEAFHVCCLPGPARKRWERADVEPLEEGKLSVTMDRKQDSVEGKQNAKSNVQQAGLAKDCQVPLDQKLVTSGRTSFPVSDIQRLGLRLHWQCQHCVTCDRCNGDSDRGQMLVCVDCGSVCHLGCAMPPLSKHVSPFRCEKCVKCQQCGATDAAGLEGVLPPGDTKPHWMYDFTMCYPCGTLYKQKKYCPICRNLWELPKGHTAQIQNSDAGGFVQCDRCRLWVHTKCDDILNDDTLNLLDEEVNYFCPDCRSSSIADDNSSGDTGNSQALMLKQRKGQTSNIAPTLLKNYLYYRQQLLRIMRMRATNTRKTSMTPEQQFFCRMSQEVHSIQCARKRKRRALLLRKNREQILFESGFTFRQIGSTKVMSRSDSQMKRHGIEKPRQPYLLQRLNDFSPAKLIIEPVFTPSRQAKEYLKALKMLDQRLELNINNIKQQMIYDFREGNGDKISLVYNARMQIDKAKSHHKRVQELLQTQYKQQIAVDKKKHEMKLREVAVLRAKMETKIMTNREGQEKVTKQSEGAAFMKMRHVGPDTSLKSKPPIQENVLSNSNTESTQNPVKTEQRKDEGSKGNVSVVGNVSAGEKVTNKAQEAEESEENLGRVQREALSERRRAVCNPALATKVELEGIGKIAMSQLIHCMVCGKQEHNVLQKAKFGGRLLPLISTRHTLLGHVHSNCILWSHSVLRNNSMLSNIDVTIRQASQMRCSVCLALGATIRCSAKECNRAFHFTCLVQRFSSGGSRTPSFQKDGKVFCEQHFKQRSNRLLLPNGPSATIDECLIIEPVTSKSVSLQSNPFFRLKKNNKSSGITRSISESTQDSRASKWTYPMNDLYLAGVANDEKETEGRRRNLTKRSDSMIAVASPGPGEWIRIGALCVWNLGSIEQTTSNFFHTETSIFPLGYRSTRIWWDCVKPGRRTVYICEIIAAPLTRGSDLVPRFRITGPKVLSTREKNANDESARVIFEAPTAAAAWRSLAERVKGFNSRNGNRNLEFGHEKSPFGLSGAHFFGYGRLEVLRRIEHLPGAHRCQRYRFLFRTEDAISGLRAQEHQGFDPRWIADRTNPYGISPALQTKRNIGSILRLKPRKGCLRAHPLNTEVEATKCTDLFVKDFGRRTKVRREAPPFELRYQENLKMPLALRYHRLKNRRHKCVVMPSQIHAWGLFATERIGRDEMVIEYLGELIRQSVADLREKRYEADGIGSCYMFRLDEDYIVDSTTRGNVSRFINHSCDPNCYTQVVKYKKSNKIVVFAKRDIFKGEEITYDYKFQSESGEGIPCSCGAPNCAGRLN